MSRSLAAALLFLLPACVAPGSAPAEARPVTRSGASALMADYRAPVHIVWRELVAVYHERGIAVPREQLLARPHGGSLVVGGVRAVVSLAPDCASTLVAVRCEDGEASARAFLDRLTVRLEENYSAR